MIVTMLCQSAYVGCFINRSMLFVSSIQLLKIWSVTWLAITFGMTCFNFASCNVASLP